jgi:putative oxidoreductase
MFQKMIATAPSWAPLPLRLGLGAVFVAHGAQKVFGAWGGPGLSAFSAADAPLGLSPSWLWMGAAAVGELLGGVLLLAGLLTRFGAFLIAAVMAVAVFGVHWKAGFFAQAKGYEYPLLCLLVAVALLVSGGGRASLDERLMHPRYKRW